MEPPPPYSHPQPTQPLIQSCNRWWRWRHTQTGGTAGCPINQTPHTSHNVPARHNHALLVQQELLKVPLNVSDLATTQHGHNKDGCEAAAARAGPPHSTHATAACTSHGGRTDRGAHTLYCRKLTSLVTGGQEFCTQTQTQARTNTTQFRLRSEGNSTVTGYLGAGSTRNPP